MNPGTTMRHRLPGPPEEYTLLLQSRLGSQVRELRIEVAAGKRIILSGRANTYYARQMAHRIASELFGDDVELANEIVVC